MGELFSHQCDKAYGTSPTTVAYTKNEKEHNMNYTRVYETKIIVKYEKIGEQTVETYLEIENSKIFLCKYIDGAFKGQTFIADLKQV